MKKVIGLKLKIFIGYALLILLLGFIIYLFRGELEKRDALNREMQELTSMRDLTRKAYSHLLELTSQGEVASIWSESDLNQYREKREATCDILRELRQFAYASEQQARIDSVCLLLQQKETLLVAAMSTFNSLENISQTVGEKVPAIVWQVRRQPTGDIPANEPATEEPEKEKKGFWKNLFGWKEKKSAYRQKREAEMARQSRKELPSSGARNGGNAVVYLLHSLNREVTDRQKEQQKKLFIQMDSLHRSSQTLNTRLSILVGDFERTAGDRLETRYGVIVADREASYDMAVALALFIFLLTIVLYTILHRDVNKRLRYRQELECLNGKNLELLAARDNMMLTVSHDLRAPLTVISGYADAITDEQAKEIRLHYCDAILQSSDNMLALLNSLLTFYRLDMGKERPENLLFRMTGIAGTLETAYRIQAEKKGLHFIVECGEDDTVLLGDRDRILQIGNNLLSNAVKFTALGSITLCLRYTQGMFLMEVSDTGTGISVDRLECIFQPFERLENAGMQDGFGLGLPITQRIVKLLQGRMTVDSEIGYGATFKVSIPLPPADEDSMQKPSLSPVSLPDSLYVAVVDNDTVLLEMTKGMFMRHKIRCDGFHSARELLERMRECAYDIVITDIRMSDINGFELLELLRTSSIEALQTIPVLAATARVEKQGKEFMKAGFSGYLHKPFSVSELFSAVKSCIREGREHPLPKADFSVLLVAERDMKEMLGLFIRETRKDMERLEKYAETGDLEQLLMLVHHLSPVWENIHIGTPLRELRGMLSSSEGAAGTLLRLAVKKVTTTGKKAVEQAEKMIRDEDYR